MKFKKTKIEGVSQPIQVITQFFDQDKGFIFLRKEY
jgi:hypothetical protein